MSSRFARIAALVGLLLGLSLTLAPTASADFAFQWSGTPASPQRWVPGPNSWDALLTNVNNEGTGISSGSFQGGHGADCGAPPATHTIAALPDTLFICNGHLMTAESDTSTYLTPAALADWSAAAAVVSFRVSTFRFSARDWWELWLTPFAENLAVPETPVSGSPFFNGPPKDALHIVQGITTGCSLGQPSFGTSNGSREGTYFHYEVYRGGAEVASGGRSNPCMEDVAGGVSAAVRSQFTLTMSTGHVRFGMTGPSSSAAWIDDNVALPFSQAVVQLAHRSYNPSKACGFDGTCGPNTFHWSDFAMTGTAPFSIQPELPPGVPVNASTPGTVTLAGPAPSGAFLRFSAFGSPMVAFDGGTAQAPHRQDAAQRAESPSSYFTPVPAGTTSVTFSGSSRGGMAWWVEDVAVWSAGSPAPSPTPTSSPTPSASPTPQPTPTASPTPSPVAISGVPCTVQLPSGPATGTCTGTFQP
jgi:hypothetical protein